MEGPTGLIEVSGACELAATVVANVICAQHPGLCKSAYRRFVAGEFFAVAQDACLVAHLEAQ